MYMRTEHKIIYCYNCKANTLYHHKDTHGNSYVESHCAECGWLEWQNRAVEREKQKWIEFNNKNGLNVKIPIFKTDVQFEDDSEANSLEM
ncbi:hypothetical protein [uncultured Rummeliibacillus sp.]|uniref:hypothetical protein n=1 Tax=uncultured Rummeliibacillus sp. TaxID=762292 RepID=UPI0026242693|nr:hypothetical protein [uncultured Rummeliibacillus sp.]